MFHELIKPTILEVGEYQRKKFRSPTLQVETKSNVSDLVTEVDKHSENLLVAAIQKHFPDHQILGEETGAHAGASDYRWVIDPLDGTANYAAGIPVFCVSVALQKAEKTILGIVYMPYLNEYYWAEPGKGAWLGERRLQVKPFQALNRCILGTGFPYDKDTHPDNNVNNAGQLIPKIRGFRRIGAAAYDLCLVAGGALDGYWEKCLKLWDIAAGQLIVEEAGGVVEGFCEGRPIALVAGSKELVQQLKTILR